MLPPIPTGRPVNRAPQGVEKYINRFMRGETQVVDARDAATVLVLRDSSDGVEVFMQRRSATMASSAGQYVFPGGLVDASDLQPGIPWAGPDLETWGRALDCTPQQAQALVCAAARETFEECGILLAGPSADSFATDTDRWEPDRLALVAHELSFGEFLKRRSLVLRSDMLHGLSRWITPEWVERRYDTRFFLTELPRAQQPREVGGESDHAAWSVVRRITEQYDKGALSLMLPTVSVLREIEQADNTVDALAAPRNMGPVRFKIIQENGEVHVTICGPTGETYAYPVGPDPGT